MKEIVTPKGTLKYRMPDIGEGWIFLSLFDSVRTAQEVFRIRGQIINHMGDLIDYSSLGYTSYKELLNDKINMNDALVKIAKEIFDDVLELLEKKN